MVQTLHLNSLVQRDSNVVSAEADSDIVMVNVARGYYYGVSDVARDIWESIEQPKTISDLVSSLVEKYNVDRSRCEEQTLSFLNDLLSEGLLQVKDGPTS